MIYWEKLKLKYLTTLLLVVVFSWANAQDATPTEVNGDPKKGEKLFNANCAACHTLDKKLVGPALGGIVEKLQTEQGLGVEWLRDWIRDNEALRNSGDEYANKIFEEYNGLIMTPFPNLSDQDIDDMLAYTTNPPVEEVVAEEEVVVAEDDGIPAGVLIIGLSVISSLLVWILFRVNTLTKLTASESLTPEEEFKLRSILDFFETNKKIGYGALGILTMFILYGAWQFMIGLGVDEGYQPEQPIYFSHKIHAGEQGIDCQMCHTSAKYGKVSGIPSTNVCMNCHYQIQEYKGDYIEEGKSREFYTAEMQKIYKAIGFDKDNFEYTGEVEPIEWVRIHNMPDFVYFNHAQHVVAGENAIKKAKGVDQVCYACHGRVDQMDEVKMANEFTMGWCIECHRETEVDMDNEYNKTYYAQLHEKLKKQYGEGTTITVDAIGGLECAKCHY